MFYCHESEPSKDLAATASSAMIDHHAVFYPSEIRLESDQAKSFELPACTICFQHRAYPSALETRFLRVLENPTGLPVSSLKHAESS